MQSCFVQFFPFSLYRLYQRLSSCFINPDGLLIFKSWGESFRKLSMVGWDSLIMRFTAGKYGLALLGSPLYSPVCLGLFSCVGQISQRRSIQSPACRIKTWLTVFQSRRKKKNAGRISAFGKNASIEPAYSVLNLSMHDDPSPGIPYLKQKQTSSPLLDMGMR